MFAFGIGAVVFIALSLYCWWLEDDFTEDIR